LQKQVAGVFPKVENTPGSLWDNSQSQKTLRRSVGQTPKGRKCPGEALGLLPKVENSPAELWAYSKKIKTGAVTFSD